MSPSVKSLAVAPGSVNVLPSIISIGLAPNNVNDGGRSITSTLRVIDEVAPYLSVAVYVRVYVPGGVLVLTEPLVLTLRTPSSVSLAVAPGSINVSPWLIWKGLAPLRVIVGNLFSITLTTRWSVTVLFEVSVIEYVNV